MDDDFARRTGRATLWRADDIVLPANISDQTLGKYVQRLWLAKMKAPFPPPPELEDFWRQIAD